MQNMHSRLKSFRENVMHVSQKKIATAVGVTQRAYAYYELGKSEPSRKTLAKLSDLGCDLTWLITGKEASRIKEGNLQEKLELAHAELVKLGQERDKLRAQLEVLKGVIDKTMYHEVESRSKSPDRRYSELRADIEMLNSAVFQLKKNLEVHEVECKINRHTGAAAPVPTKDEIVIPAEEMKAASPKMREALTRYRGQVDALMEFGARMAQELAEKKEKKET
jgi:transcriptional regulator with XRE-family HTH domain